MNVKYSIKIIFFIAMLATMSTTSLANSLSRIRTFHPLNTIKINLCEEKLMFDSYDDSLKVNHDTIYAIVEVEPSFPGGPAAMSWWLQSHVTYPESAIGKNEQGIVYVRFVVNIDGSISNIQIKKSVSESLDQEAIRVVSIMPKWIPAELQGEFVSTYFTLPIAFRLSEPTKEKSRQ